MCNTSKLLEAAVLIAQLKGKEVTAIQYEDGSFKKFNYQLDNSGKWEFIDLSITGIGSSIDLGLLHYHQIDVLDEVKRFKIVPTITNGLFTKQSS